MAQRNYTELINAAELQINNERNNPTMQNLLIDLHKGINHYKAKAERAEADLKQAEVDMKSIAQGIDCCEFCKNAPPDLNLCDDVNLDCEKCPAEECTCRFCATNGTFNFEWRGIV